MTWVGRTRRRTSSLLMGQEIWRFKWREKKPSLGLPRERRSRRRAAATAAAESTTTQDWPGTGKESPAANRESGPRVRAGRGQQGQKPRQQLGPADGQPGKTKSGAGHLPGGRQEPALFRVELVELARQGGSENDGSGQKQERSLGQGQRGIGGCPAQGRPARREARVRPQAGQAGRVRAQYQDAADAGVAEGEDGALQQGEPEQDPVGGRGLRQDDRLLNHVFFS